MPPCGLLHIINGIPDEITCRKFGEYLKTDRVPIEDVRLFFEHFPHILQLLYQWIDHPMAQNPNAPMAQTVCTTFLHDSAFFQMIRHPRMASPSFAFPLNRVPTHLVNEVTSKSKVPSSWIGQEVTSNVYYDSFLRALVFKHPLDYFLCVFSAFLVRDKAESLGPGPMGALPMTGIRPMMPMQQRGMILMEDTCSYPYEVLLLDYLRVFMPHSNQVLSLYASSTPTVFAGILADFWFRNEKIKDHIEPSLSSLQIVILHMLANPGLHQQSKMKSVNPVHNLSRELQNILPHVVEMLTKALSQPLQPGPGKLDNFMSVIQLWLIVMQPWKAPMIYEGLVQSRAAPKKLVPGEKPAPVRKPANEPSFNSLGFPAISSDGRVLDAWKPYIHYYWSLYSLLRQVLHHGSISILIDQMANMGPANTGQPIAPAATMPVSFRSIETLCQLMLCFTDPHLIPILATTQPRMLTRTGDIFSGTSALDPEIVAGGRRIWRALKIGTQSRCPPEITDAMKVVGRQLQQSTYWHGAQLEPTEFTTRSLSFVSNCVSKVLTSVDTLRTSPSSALKPSAPLLRTESLTETSPSTERQEIRRKDGRLTDIGRTMVCQGESTCRISDTYYHGSEWAKPLVSSEFSPLFKFAQAVAWGADAVLKRERYDYPDTEWPRVFATWYVSAFLLGIVAYGFT